MNAVGAADLRRQFEFQCAALEHVEEGLDLRQQNFAGIAQQQGISRIDHIGRGQSVVNKSGGFTDRFRQVGGKGDDVVVSSLFDLVNAFDRKFGPALNLFQRVG